MKRAKTPTFLIDLPLRVDWSQERRLRAHLEAARCFYNAVLSEANKRLRLMCNDPAWTQARAIPRSHKQERAQAFADLRKTYHFSEDELHAYAKRARVSWIAEHIDSTMAQTLATRAYQAANRVCVGKAKRVRFRSKGRGIDSVEGKRNDVGMRFVLDPNAGDGGFLIWNTEVIPAIIDWRDPVVLHGMRHRIKYVRLIRRKASSLQAQGADYEGNRYSVQVVFEGHAFVKPKHEKVGTSPVGLDIGPSSATRGRAQNCFMHLNRSSEAYCSTSSTLERRSGEVTSRSRSPLTTFLSLLTAHRTVRRDECLLASKRIGSQGEWYGQRM